MNNTDSTTKVLLCILSAIVPLLGLIFYFTERKNDKESANAYLLIGVIFWILWIAIL